MLFAPKTLYYIVLVNLYLYFLGIMSKKPSFSICDIQSGLCSNLMRDTIVLSLPLDISSITALMRSQLILVFNFSKIVNKNLSALPAVNNVESSRLSFFNRNPECFNAANIILAISISCRSTNYLNLI